MLLVANMLTELMLQLWLVVTFYCYTQMTVLVILMAILQATVSNSESSY